MPDLHTPYLEAIEVDGTLPVIYSRLSMSAGWEQLPRAYNKGYADADALKLGVNVSIGFFNDMISEGISLELGF